MPRRVILFQSQVNFKRRHCVRVALYLGQFPAHAVGLKTYEQGTTSVMKILPWYNLYGTINHYWKEAREQLSNQIKLTTTVYLRPQGSFSAMLSTVLAILGKRSSGSKTSPHANCACFALLSSTSTRFARAWQAPSNSSATISADIQNTQSVNYNYPYSNQ